MPWSWNYADWLCNLALSFVRLLLIGEPAQNGSRRVGFVLVWQCVTLSCAVRRASLQRLCQYGSMALAERRVILLVAPANSDGYRA